MPPNYSLLSIPLYWIIALFPHGYAVNLIKNANNQFWDNRNPRGAATNAAYAKSVPAATYARFERAEAAHKNAMENAPFFIGAVLAANMAGVEARTMNAVTATCLVLRVAYAVLYVRTTRQKASYARSLTWLMSMVVTMGLYVLAGREWAGR